MLSDTRLRRRALFVLGNLTACAVFAGAVAMPMYAMFADRDRQIDEQTRRLSRLTAVAAQAVSLESIASDTKVQLQSGEFLSASNENVVSADLQTKLKAMTEACGARSRAIQALPIKTIDQIKYSGSRIEIFGSLQSILRAIHTMESSRPYLFVTGAVLRVLPAARQGGSEEPVVQAQLDVFGAMQLVEQP
jgi:hypothetical protein